MQILFILLLSCKGCGSCWVMPGLPNVAVTDPPPFDTGVDDPPPEDTGEELPPASICLQQEVEPNNDIRDAQDVAMEEWMCGIFGEPADNDLFTFDVESDAWVRVWIRASELGSLANPRAFLYDEDEEFAASFEDSFLSEDIDRTFKLDKAREMYIGLLEQNTGSLQYGEEYDWRMRVSIVKAPVDWNTEEIEDNDSRDSANIVSDGDRVFGRVENGFRYDWYMLEVTEERTEVVVQTDAWIHGSPLNPEIMVEGPDGEEIDKRHTHDSSSNYDAKVAFTAMDTGEYLIRVGACCSGDSGGRGGGLPHWYVLDVDAQPVEGGAADTGSGK